MKHLAVVMRPPVGRGTELMGRHMDYRPSLAVDVGVAVRRKGPTRESDLSLGRQGEAVAIR